MIADQRAVGTEALTTPVYVAATERLLVLDV